MGGPGHAELPCEDLTVLGVGRLQEGSIRLGGIDVRELQQASLRGAVAVVPQDTVLFADSILRNIRYGRPSASFEEIQAAAGAQSLPSLLSIAGQHVPVLAPYAAVARSHAAGGVVTPPTYTPSEGHDGYAGCAAVFAQC